MLEYIKKHKWRIISSSVLVGGVYYYFRDYIDLFMSLNELASNSEQPKPRSEIAKQRFAAILASSDEIAVSDHFLSFTACPRLVQLQAQLRDKTQDEVDRKRLFREFVCASLARNLSILALRNFARQFLRVSGVLATSRDELSLVLEDLKLGMAAGRFDEFNSRVVEIVHAAISDPTLEVSTAEMEGFLERLALEIFSILHRVVELQPQDGRLQAAVASAMIDPRWRANLGRRLLTEFGRIGGFFETEQKKFPIAKILAAAANTCETAGTCEWTSEYEETLFDWSTKDGDSGEGENPGLLAMIEKLAKSM